MKRLISIAAALVLATGMLSGQTPAETKLYNKTLKKPSVKAYDKFLNKYPDSVYSIEILTLKDSTLFAAVDKEDAEAVEAFAAAHPDSPVAVQVEEIIARHNTTPLSREEALAAVRMLVPEAADAVGMDKLMWGSDYPRTITAITYRMSYDFVTKSPELSDDDKRLFLCDNARRFFGFGELKELPYIKNMSE